VKFPKRLRHNGKGKVWATIYKRSDCYRLYWRSRVDGKPKSHFKDFSTYSKAKDEGDELVKALAKGKAPTLSPGQISDATAAFQRLHRYFVDTGRRVSLLEGISIFCESAAKLPGGFTLADVVQRFLSTEATVKRKMLKDAVSDFIEGRKHLGKSKNGERSKRSPVYLYNTAMWLNEFEGTLRNKDVCDISKEDLNIYIKKFSGLSAKSRNDRRAIVKQFLRWCVAKDFLLPNHRLFEAVDFKAEDQDQREIDFYRSKELRDMLTTADSELVPVLALGGLAGIRREEIMRLDWSDVWRVKGKVEISERIAKGRQRRLVSMCPALSAWLRPCRKSSGPVWGKSPDALEEALAALRQGLKIPSRRNGLRHAFITFHMAKHCNENLTAAECGNSPQIIHDHYRALATRQEAVKWFAVKPAKSGAKIVALPVAAGGAA
jgi:integrase